jgi:hypothetical protein
MYRLYEKVAKTEEYEYGIKLIEKEKNPFKEGPCLLSMIAIAMWEKDINGALNQGMEAIRLKTNHNKNIGTKIEDFEGKIISLAYGEPSEKATIKGKNFTGSISRKEKLDDEFTQKYLFPLIEDNGKKIDILQAMKNMRNVNIMTYCGATQSALRMEECLVNRMNELGYSEDEISKIQSQMCIIGYATDIKMRAEFAENKKIKSTCLSFGDVNDGDVGAPQGIREIAKKNNTIYYNEGYYFHYGNGEHSLKNYILQNDSLSLGISSVITRAVNNSIENHKSSEFKPLTQELLTQDIEKIIEGIRQGKKREELITLVDKGINYGKTQKSIRELLDLKQQEYSKKLISCSPESIEEAFKILEEKRKRVELNRQSEPENEDNLDKETKTIFELMSKYEQDIKQIFISSNETITHITDVPPKNMIGGKISKSINRANNYETERGNWVFASSNLMDGKNPYIARDSKSGMVLIDQNTYIYGSDNMQIQHDEQGQSRVILKKPNYAYKINPEKFKPVVTLRRDERGTPFFEFSEEWISKEEVDISDSEQVLNVEEITDITEVIENYQILCDVNRTGEAMKIRGCSNREEAIQKLFDSIKSGDLRYINGEANINVSQMLENSGLVNTIGKSTINVHIQAKDNAKGKVEKEQQYLKQTQEEQQLK